MFNRPKILITVAIAFFLFGCSLGKKSVPPDKIGEDINSHPAVIHEQTGVDARARASNELMLRACKLIEGQRFDDAIDTLERAIALDPKEGQNYYHLSSVWMMKGNAAQALEFNRLAEIYLSYDADWVQKVTEQRKSIQQAQ